MTKVLTESGDRAMKWLASRQSPNGNFSTAPPTLTAHYKAPMAFAECGLRSNAERCISWLTNSFMRSDGHYTETANHRSQDRRCDLYEDMWISWAAQTLGQRDIESATVGLILAHLDRHTGGVRSRIGLGEPAITDLRSTAFGGIVLLYAGELQAAILCGMYLTDLMNLQANDSSTFYLVRGANGDLVTIYPAAERRYFEISPRVSRPLYYGLGFALAFFCELHRITRDDRYVTAIRGVAQICSGLAPGIFESDYSGKVAWGHALLYRQFGTDVAKDHVLRSLTYLARGQLDTGEWEHSRLSELDDVTRLALVFDQAAERGFWLRRCTPLVQVDPAH